MKHDIQIQKENLEGFIAGDRMCFKNIYDCYRDRVYAYTCKITKSHELPGWANFDSCHPHKYTPPAHLDLIPVKWEEITKQN